MTQLINPITLTQELIQCPSVTPIEGGAISLLEKTLSDLGFCCHRLTFQEEGTEAVENLYARLGTTAPNFCFAGHTDVVPIGAKDEWSFDPFSGDLKDGYICGRGASDMKGAIAAFIAAVSQFIRHQNLPENGSISLLITGDEEGPAHNGTKKVLPWMIENNEIIDLCLVGEPTNPSQLGEMMKVGRRGSLNGLLTVQGTQGHVAYPHLAENPLPQLIDLLKTLTELKLDQGSDLFQPSNLEIVSIDVGNTVSNVIPAQGTAKFNIRFNDHHTGASLEKYLRQSLDKCNGPYQLDISISGESFFTSPGELSDLISNAVQKVTGETPELSTSGGTSDARFITNYCPVVEFGIVGKTMHKVDEKVTVNELNQLTEIYFHILRQFFSQK